MAYYAICTIHCMSGELAECELASRRALNAIGRTSFEKDFLLINEHYWIIPLLIEMYTDQKYRSKIETLLSSFMQEHLGELNYNWVKKDFWM